MLTRWRSWLEQGPQSFMRRGPRRPSKFEKAGAAFTQGLTDGINAPADPMVKAQMKILELEQNNFFLERALEIALGPERYELFQQFVEDGDGTRMAIEKANLLAE